MLDVSFNTYFSVTTQLESHSGDYVQEHYDELRDIGDECSPGVSEHCCMATCTLLYKFSLCIFPYQIILYSAKVRLCENPFCPPGQY